MLPRYKTPVYYLNPKFVLIGILIELHTHRSLIYYLFVYSAGRFYSFHGFYDKKNIVKKRSDGSSILIVSHSVGLHTIWFYRCTILLYIIQYTHRYYVIKYDRRRKKSVFRAGRIAEKFYQQLFALYSFCTPSIILYNFNKSVTVMLYAYRVYIPLTVHARCFPVSKMCSNQIHYYIFYINICYTRNTR